MMTYLQDFTAAKKETRNGCISMNVFKKSAKGYAK